MHYNLAVNYCVLYRRLASVYFVFVQHLVYQKLDIPFISIFTLSYLVSFPRQFPLLPCERNGVRSVCPAVGLSLYALVQISYTVAQVAIMIYNWQPV